jgi:hypothetical protein
MTSSDEQLQKIATSQKRQQVALILLSIVLAASTVVTWKSVAAMREANEIQRQLLPQQKADPGPKAAPVRRSSARAESKTNTQSHGPQSLAGEQERIGSRQGAVDSTPGTHIANAGALPKQPGRQ